MDEEGRLDVGQSAEEEGNYVHQPQPKPALELMNEKAEEIMAKEDLESVPTLEQTQKA
jgi:hypothetical protein